MAVIITNMDMPKDCCECILRYQAFCFDGHHEPHLDKSRCPLKSADEMIDDIDNISIREIITNGDYIFGYTNKTAEEYSNEVMNIIHKYCYYED